MTPKDFVKVSELMQLYFEGLHNADSSQLRKVFHPKLAYICATEGDELFLDLETYMSRVDQREPPAMKGEPRKENIFEISFCGPRLAHVTARMSMMGREYVDHLTLVPHQSEWRVVTKAFAYVPQED